ncbi:MAG: TIR domain-containing protein, partial [Anaerolineales bacterium]
MEKQRRTFLSYSRANKDFALKLARELKSEGFPIWLDQLDIPLGARWDAEVEKALIECEIFMIIITRDSISSENVLDEIGYAIDSGKRFLPVLMEKCNIPLRLRRFQYVDFTNKSFDEGVEAAKQLLGTLVAQPTVPRKDTPEKTRDPVAQASSPAAQTSEAAQAHPTTTARLRREKIEQELRFKAEQEQLLQEKADLEKKLREEQLALEKMADERKAVAEIPTPAARPRSKLIGLFGFAVVAILIAAFAIPRLLSGAASTERSKEIPTAAEVAAAIPVTSRESPVPSTEPPTSAPPATEAATVIASGPLPEITDDRGAAMVLVPAGDFLMGSDRGETDEQPAHTVYLGAFYIDKFEVTNQLYQACVDDGKCDLPRQTYFFAESPNKIYYGNPQYDNYPVI